LCLRSKLRSIIFGCHIDCCVLMCSEKVLNPVQTWLPSFSAMHHVAIGRTSRPFPRSKPSGPVFRHSAFRTRSSDPFWTLLLQGRSPVLQVDHARVVSHRRFGIFRSPRVGSFPGGPSSCPSHYKMAFGYYAASALCPARWHSRVPFGSSSIRVPQFRVDVFAQPVACLLYAGCLVGEPSLMCKQ